MTLLSTVDETARKNINKKIEDLNSTVDQLDLINICRTLHTTHEEYTLFSSKRETFSKIAHRCDVGVILYIYNIHILHISYVLCISV